MRRSMVACVVVAVWIGPSFGQETVPQGQSVITVKPAASPADPSLPTGRIADCRNAARARHLKGDDFVDDQQICVATARLDCLKSAVDRKVRGPARADFVRACLGN